MPTLTLDIELPEAEYRFAARDMSLYEDEEIRADPTPFTRDAIEGLREAVAQQDAGSGIDWDLCFARLYGKRAGTQTLDLLREVSPHPSRGGERCSPRRLLSQARPPARLPPEAPRSAHG